MKRGVAHSAQGACFSIRLRSSAYSTGCDSIQAGGGRFQVSLGGPSSSSSSSCWLLRFGLELLLAGDGALRVEAGLRDVTEDTGFLGGEAALDQGLENGTDEAVDVGRGGERAGSGEKFVGEGIVRLGGRWRSEVVLAPIRAGLGGVAAGKTVAGDMGAARATRGGRVRRLRNGWCFYERVLR